jgi:hypothetical protein
MQCSGTLISNFFLTERDQSKFFCANRSYRLRFLDGMYMRELKAEAVSTSETSVNFYRTTYRNIADDKSSSYSPP